MLRKFCAALLFSAVVTGVSVPAPSYAQTEDAQTAEEIALAATQTQIENLIIQYATDASGFAAALQQLILTAADPVLATRAATQALTNPKNEAAMTVLVTNPMIKVSGGNAITAATNSVFTSDPDAAYEMQQIVKNSGDSTLITTVGPDIAEPPKPQDPTDQTTDNNVTPENKTPVDSKSTTPPSPSR